MTKKIDEHMVIDDIAMVGARPNHHNGAFVVRWSSERGFGEYTLIKNSDGTISVDTECDGIDMVKHALCKLIDKAIIRD